MSGASIQSHAAGLLSDPTAAGGVWWCGESAKTDDLSTHGVNCYYSADFSSGGMNWSAVGLVLSQADVIVPGHPGPFTLERPKLLYHADSGMFVMWSLQQQQHSALALTALLAFHCASVSPGSRMTEVDRRLCSSPLALLRAVVCFRVHIDDAAYSVRRVGVAVSADIHRGFSFVRSFQPDGLPSLDMSVFSDCRDGRVVGAYFVRSVDNSYVGISRITKDYMDTDGLISVIPEAREGHALFYHAQFDRYFMLTSHLTGWASNGMEGFISSSSDLDGAEWSSIGNPTNSDDSFNSQPAIVWPYTSRAANLSYFIYMGDRWNYPNLLNASYIWSITQHT